LQNGIPRLLNFHLKILLLGPSYSGQIAMNCRDLMVEVMDAQMRLIERTTPEKGLIPNIVKLIGQ
jgi:hypothetical protein